MSEYDNQEMLDSNIKGEYKIGYIMPISDTDGYQVDHWGQVKSIFDEVFKEITSENEEQCSFKCSIVSEGTSDDTIIHNNIVTNTYNSNLIICDVSAANPNVMFELGMRLAFDKKVIVVKDEETRYNFDTSPIRHITYDSTLRYHHVKKFKDDLKKHIKTVLQTGGDKGDYLESFGRFNVQELESKDLSVEQAINKLLDSVNDLKVDNQRLYTIIKPLFMNSMGNINLDNKRINSISNNDDLILSDGRLRSITEEYLTKYGEDADDSDSEKDLMEFLEDNYPEILSHRRNLQKILKILDPTNKDGGI